MAHSSNISGAEHWSTYERLKLDDPQGAAAYWRTHKDEMVKYGRQLVDSGYMGLFSSRKVRTASSIQQEVFDREMEQLRSQNSELTNRVRQLETENTKLTANSGSGSPTKEDIERRVNTMVLERIAGLGVAPIKLRRDDNPRPKDREQLIDMLKTQLKKEKRS